MRNFLSLFYALISAGLRFFGLFLFGLICAFAWEAFVEDSEVKYEPALGVSQELFTFLNSDDKKVILDGRTLTTATRGILAKCSRGKPFPSVADFSIKNKKLSVVSLVHFRFLPKPVVFCVELGDDFRLLGAYLGRAKMPDVLTRFFADEMMSHYLKLDGVQSLVDSLGTKIKMKVLDDNCVEFYK